MGMSVFTLRRARLGTLFTGGRKDDPDPPVIGTTELH